MKNYVELLNDEDTRYLCQVIGGKFLRKLYENNAKRFNKMLPGFRPGKLSDERTFNFAVDNRNKEFVATFFNRWIHNHLEEISSEITKTGDGIIELAEVLAMSVFNGRPQLYFVLTETQPSEDSCAIFCHLIEKIIDKMSDKNLIDKFVSELQECSTYVSLCQVHKAENGKSMLHRLADIQDGELTEVVSQEHLHLPLKDGLSTEGFIGVWFWKTLVGDNDDCIFTSYCHALQPIELVIVKDCPTMPDLAKKLQSGISCEPHSERIVFAIDKGTTFEGIYCNRDTSFSRFGKVILNPEITKLPVLDIKQSKFIMVGGATFLTKIGIETPSELIEIHNQTDEQEQPGQKSSVIHFVESEELSLKNPDINDNYEQLLMTIQNELSEAGATNSSIRGLSAILYSAYINRIPLLLAGPNGMEIVTAFTASLNCTRPAVLTCEGELEPQALLACENSSSNVIVIENPLNTKWNNAVIKMISKRTKMYFLLNPFAEDLTIEPRGLFNYCLPILTELFVESFSTSRYIGGKFSAKYKPYVPQKTNRLYDKLFNAMNIKSLTRSNCQQILSDVHELLKTNDYQMILYSLAYVLGEASELEDFLEKYESVLRAT